MSNSGPSCQGGLSLIEASHETDHSLSPFQMLFPFSVLIASTYVSNHLQIGDWKRLSASLSHPFSMRFGAVSALEHLWAEPWKLWIQVFQLWCVTIRVSRESLRPHPGSAVEFTLLACPQPLGHSWPITWFPFSGSGVGWGVALPPSALPHRVIVVVCWKIALNWLSLEASMNVHDQDWAGVVEWSIPRFTVILGWLWGWRVYFKAWFNIPSWELWKELGLGRFWIC